MISTNSVAQIISGVKCDIVLEAFSFFNLTFLVLIGLEDELIGELSTADMYMFCHSCCSFMSNAYIVLVVVPCML